MITMTSLANLILCATLAGAAPDKLADACARAIAPFLEDRTIAVLYVDLPALDVEALAGRLVAVGKLKATDLAEPKKTLSALLKSLTGAGARDAFVVFSLVDLPEDPPFVIVPLGKGADARALTKALDEANLLGGTIRFEKMGAALVGGSASTRKHLRKLTPLARPEVARALAGGGMLRLIALPTKDTARILEEMAPDLPDELGGGPITPFTRGLRWAALSVSAPPKLAASLTVQAPDAKAAKALHAALAKVSRALARNKEVRKLVPDLDKLLPLLLPKVAGDRLTLSLTEKTLIGVARPYVLHALQERARSRASQPLRRLMQAMHDYHDAHRRFPAAASHDAEGKPLLSWRVHLLPHLGHKELYKEFKLDQPWDSPHNKKLIAKMPAVYRPANAKLAAQHKTTYLAPVGEVTVFPGKKSVRVFDILDGTSITIMLVDATDDFAVVWTKPDDLKYDPKQPAKGLAARHGGTFMLAFADGSVHFLPADGDKKNLHALFTRAGGEVVTLP
jgi:prepilin-type processing-associated H-X9-DG protein